MDTSKKYTVPALEKALAIIETLADQEVPMGVSELCKKVNVPKTSAFFILNTLEQNQYITKSEDGKYLLGNRFVNLGQSILNRIDIRQHAKPFMEELCRETGFTVHLAILDQGEAVYIEKVENQAFVKFSTYIGQRWPLHVSGVGKALASQLTDEELEQIVERVGLSAKTDNTVTSLKEFKAVLSAARKQGYAIEDEEGEVGIRCIGSSVFGHDGKQKAAISITALRSELPVQEIPVIGDKVRRIALRISAHLGYRLPASPGEASNAK
ncbi:IclR family transcriptional regulator [Cohnella herbarum]|uniref:IclR family transcriptional regulator n=1 Tax=Cohnella herbarum TaxID=2728023 RepID=A0A7Z2ZQK6_9BACL|nr:IclR family transcriptional regulator [Cohnella herbarum]QJD87127.1 IclR family transcriptional regulator [Cohnella herbarum]